MGGIRCGRLVLALTALLLMLPGIAQASSLPAGFHDSEVLSGLTAPTAVKFASDGRVFVAEKSGRILVYSSLEYSTPAVFADLGANVHDYWDRGLLGLALAPGFPADPYVYALYTYDSHVPKWGDMCPTPPGPVTNGCVVKGRLSRLQANGDVMTGPEQVLVEDWCQQFPSHSMGDLEFGADGWLYASAGDGASWLAADYGQNGGNACGDPFREGGALRSQDARTSGDPLGLDGSVIRVDPATGAHQMLAYGFRNPFRFALRPGANELWIGDVGWGSVEEVDRLPLGFSEPVRNFGWPCYEGEVPPTAYEEQGLPICEGLYATPGAVTPPFYAYQHSDEVVPGCLEGGSSIAGLAFYRGDSYPGYKDALFLADYSRNCIWTLLPDATGVPDPATGAAFELEAKGPVDLEIGPNGDVFYVDFGGGAIRRIRFRPPIAVATADPTSGTAPLTVRFDGSQSTDSDGGHSLSYAWYFDPGNSVDSTDSQPTHVFARGSWTVRLKVTDTKGLTSTASVVVNVDNAPPVASIVAPAAGTSWRVDDTISFSGSATDPEDGALSPSRLSWKLLLHHCVAIGDCHIHQVQTWNGVAAESFVAPDHDYPSYLELQLTATDLDGLTDTETVRLDPATVLLRFLTQPSGLDLVVGSEAHAAPFEREVIVGSRNAVTAPSPQALLLFSSWSDGGARSHDVVAPATAATYTATFAPAASPPPQPPPAPPPPPPVPIAPKLVHCVVPMLIGRPVLVARPRLTRAHCRLGHMAWVYSGTPKGLVRTQNPRAGRRLSNLARVAVVVSRGPARKPKR